MFFFLFSDQALVYPMQYIAPFGPIIFNKRLYCMFKKNLHFKIFITKNGIRSYKAYLAEN